MPAYVIFHDTTLAALAEAMPRQRARTARGSRRRPGQGRALRRATCCAVIAELRGPRRSLVARFAACGSASSSGSPRRSNRSRTRTARPSCWRTMATLPKVGGAELLEQQHRGRPRRPASPLSLHRRSQLGGHRRDRPGQAVSWVEESVLDRTTHVTDWQIVPDHYASRLHVRRHVQRSTERPAGEHRPDDRSRDQGRLSRWSADGSKGPSFPGSRSTPRPKRPRSRPSSTQFDH